MTEKEKQNTIIMMQQLESLGLLDNFITSLAAGENETESEKKSCKELAQRFYECADKIEWKRKDAEYFKSIINNVLTVTDAELETHKD